MAKDQDGNAYNSAVDLKFDDWGSLIVPLDTNYDINVYIEVTTKGNLKAYTAVNFISYPCSTEILKSKSISYYNIE